MAAVAVDSYNFGTPDLDTATMVSGHEFPFPTTSSAPGSVFLESNYGTDSNFNEAFGFDTLGADAHSYTEFDFEAQPLPASLTPPGGLEQVEPVHKQGPTLPTLQQIDTSYTYPQARIEYGQYTPPDEAAPTQSQLPSPVPEVKQEPETSLHNSAPKRKRSGTSDASPPKRRRSRKGTAAPAPEGESQDPVEHEKRHKFLERNRVAASKCRQKKKEWTNNLEHQARNLAASKKQLSILAASLKEEVMWLKGEMLKHTDCGCHRVREYLSLQADSIASGGRSPVMCGGPSISNSAGTSPGGNMSRPPTGDWQIPRRASISEESIRSAGSQDRPATGMSIRDEANRAEMDTN